MKLTKTNLDEMFNIYEETYAEVAHKYATGVKEFDEAVDELTMYIMNEYYLMIRNQIRSGRLSKTDLDCVTFCIYCKLDDEMSFLELDEETEEYIANWVAEDIDMFYEIITEE